MDKSFYISNRNKYFEKIENHSLSLFFSGQTYPKSADEDFEFEVNKNFYYLTGINQENVILALVKREEPETVLFIEKNDPVLSRWVGKKLEKAEAKEIWGSRTSATWMNSRIFSSIFSTTTGIIEKNPKLSISI